MRRIETCGLRKTNDILGVQPNGASKSEETVLRLACTPHYTFECTCKHFTMTCTIGFLDGRQVYIATDSASTAEDGHIVVRHGNTKAWTVQVRHGPELLVGFSGNFTDLNFIRYMFQWPKWRSPSMMHYLVSQVFLQ